MKYGKRWKVSGDVRLIDTFRCRCNGKIYWRSGAFLKKPHICFISRQDFNSDSRMDGVDFAINYRIKDDGQ